MIWFPGIPCNDSRLKKVRLLTQDLKNIIKRYCYYYYCCYLRVVVVVIVVILV
jgi:hypothetical protein